MYSKELEKIEALTKLLNNEIKALTDKVIRNLIEDFTQSNEEDFETYLDANFPMDVWRVDKDMVTDVEDLITSVWLEEYIAEANYLKAEKCKYGETIREILEELGVDELELTDKQIVKFSEILEKKFDK